MGRIVIACYRPKEGKRDALRALVAEHLPLLRAEGLATEREPVLMEAADGTILEVFEWRSPEAIASAHSNPSVLALWERFEAVCEWLPVSAVAEASRPFSEFTPLQ